MLETEETRELVKAYALLVGQLADYENEKIEVYTLASFDVLVVDSVGGFHRVK